jgi:ketosteroid isomerase-like protein
MSQENVEVVRQPIVIGARSRRRLEERISLRFPAIRSLVGRAVWSLPPRSRLRQALIRRSVKLGFEALNRGDFKSAFSAYDPEVELVPAPQLKGLGLDNVYRGLEGRTRFQERWHAEWGDFQHVPEEVIDLGDGGVFVLGRLCGTGRSSGAAFDSDLGVVFTISAGRVIREQSWLDRDEALEAAGLKE